MVNKNLVYNDILFNKFKNKSNILNVGIHDVYNPKLNFQNITYTEFKNFSIQDDKKFDYVIFFNLLSQNEENVKSYLKKSKTLFKENGYVLVVNIIITSYSQYVYHPFSYLQNFIFGKAVYLTDLDDMLREEKYKIVNMTRLYSINWIPLYPVEFFCFILKI